MDSLINAAYVLAHVRAVIVLASTGAEWGLVGAVHLSIPEPLAVAAEAFHVSRRKKATG